MKCRFLAEVRVKSCHASAFRKMIPESALDASGEKCSSAAYRDCPVYRDRPCAGPDQGPCPYSHESVVQYCEAAPSVRFVPYSESQLCRCGSEGHEYCEVYSALVRPGEMQAPGPEVAGIPVPERLYFAPNHMWLDALPNGLCHIGMDALFTRLVGGVERISFITVRGIQRPCAAVTVRGVSWPMLFPNPILITGINTVLRADPGRLAVDPYRAGWMFEGWDLPHSSVQKGPSAIEGLVRGPRAAAWMEHEAHRVNEYLHANAGQGGLGEAALLHDGGEFRPGVVEFLGRDEMLGLFHECFAAQDTWMRNG